ncbi:hypothetical protein BDB00DRAFT_906490 [Zychaea mexicana]|uniref:uncharacterized protein n=1 Tax=Zychaea mexicana TaxID=64656 RepID=UPI0022FE874C|nr:uncharacterized protein BDB00DRAFT_906490 [Zychaea mexicana]KAI9493676.1 hypothetical protein BDB00DRAFT_906490 [Zychaea mexicana]
MWNCLPIRSSETHTKFSRIYTCGNRTKRSVVSSSPSSAKAIEDFNSDNPNSYREEGERENKEPSCSCSESCAEKSIPHDNEGLLDNTAHQQRQQPYPINSRLTNAGEKTLLCYPSDEKTAIEEPPSSVAIHADKTLVEEDLEGHTITTKKKSTSSYMPLDQLNIRFSNDFSTLMDQFATTRDRNKEEPELQQVAEAACSEPAIAVDTIEDKEVIDEKPREEDRGDNYQPPPPFPTTKVPSPSVAPAAVPSAGFGSGKEEATQAFTTAIPAAATGMNDKYLVEKEEPTLPFPPPPPPPPLIITIDSAATTAATTTTSNSSTVTTPQFTDYNQNSSPMALSVCHPQQLPSPSPLIATPRSRSSISSRRSRRLSTLSKKSSKSSRYFPKQLKEEHQQQQQQSDASVKYHARTYDEMMRVPDIRERIAFYDRTYKQCMRADSKLSSWVKQAKEKGLPKPMTEGYVPPPRPASPEIQPTPTMSSSLSGSISMFLRKASVSNSVTMPRRAAFSGETPKPSLSRLFLPTSISRLSLSRSSRPKIMPYADDIESPQQQNRPCQQPKSKPSSTATTKKQHQKQPRPSIDSTMSTAASTAATSRWRGSIRLSTSSRRSSTESLPSASPLSISSSVSSRLSRTLRKASCDTVLPSNERPSIPTFPQHHRYHPPQPAAAAPAPLPPRTIKPIEQGPEAALNELCNVLPQLDRRVVQEYLTESGGDPMVAITLAMSQHKKVVSNSNTDNKRNKNPPPPVYKKHRQRVKS